MKASLRQGPLPEGIPSGLCQCGCGQKTPLASESRRDRDWVRGQPLRFIQGHGGRRRQRELEYLVNPETGCWVWQRGRSNTTGGPYGVLGVGGRPLLAHRWYYEEAKGRVPNGMELDHLCRNPLCVNPEHLEPVTSAENTRRGRSTKLTVEQVREVRASSETTAALARRFGVSETAIRNIRFGKSWRDAL